MIKNYKKIQANDFVSMPVEKNAWNKHKERAINIKSNKHKERAINRETLCFLKHKYEL